VPSASTSIAINVPSPFHRSIQRDQNRQRRPPTHATARLQTRPPVRSFSSLRHRRPHSHSVHRQTDFQLCNSYQKQTNQKHTLSVESFFACQLVFSLVTIDRNRACVPFVESYQHSIHKLFFDDARAYMNACISQTHGIIQTCMHARCNSSLCCMQMQSTLETCMNENTACIYACLYIELRPSVRPSIETRIKQASKSCMHAAVCVIRQRLIRSIYAPILFP
jgi:hypothetical protein